jgi:hypothetical protein
MDSRLLETARLLGYVSVQFWDKGKEGQFLFDLTAGVPACDFRRLLCP